MAQVKKSQPARGQVQKTPPKKQARKNKWLLPAGIISALVVIAAIVIASLNNGDSSGNGNVAAGTGQDLVIPISELSTTAKFYPVTVDGVKLEVLAVKAPDGTIRTAFNTCQVCYGSGKGYYEQSGDVLVCQNCGNRFKMSQVEIESGGCNPWPIFDKNKTVDDTNITIPYAFLKESTGIFSNWKTTY